MARIRSARKLVLEGAAMRHCVADYRPELAAGISSFWSLTCGGKRRLTIEVRTDEMKIVAICGKANRRPRPDEMRQVEEWAQASGLALDGGLIVR
ncbi:MAG: PcfJ domain-containing protein [Thioalkalivibrio sp.]|nr:PcfJ domain-containing protein [Thioalkalivibrio sp.]